MPLRLAVFARVREDARKEANTGRLSPCPRYGRKFLEMLVRHGEEEAALDFREEDQIAQLRRLWQSIELEIVRVLEALNELRESPDYELHRLTERSPQFFDETVGRHLESLEAELAALGTEAEALAGEIEELTGEPATGIE